MSMFAIELSRYNTKLCFLGCFNRVRHNRIALAHFRSTGIEQTNIVIHRFGAFQLENKKILDIYLPDFSFYQE